MTHINSLSMPKTAENELSWVLHLTIRPEQKSKEQEYNMERKADLPLAPLVVLNSCSLHLCSGLRRSTLQCSFLEFIGKRTT